MFQAHVQLVVVDELLNRGNKLVYKSCTSRLISLSAPLLANDVGVFRLKDAENGENLAAAIISQSSARRLYSAASFV